jgi:uncharacterized protein (TIGR02453 family)
VSAAFEGFGPAVTDWFVALASDNSRAYWTATRDIWQRDVRTPLEALLAEAAADAAADAGGGVKLFRPYRDLRFGGAEAPMKTAAGGLVLPPAGSAAARYVEVSAEGFYAGTGYYRLERDQLAAYRRAAAGDAGDALAAALAEAQAAGLEVGGEVLTGAPQGVARDHPRIALLRRKGVFVGASLPPGDALETRAPLDHARRVWTLAAPVVAWLDAHVGASAESEPERPERRRVRV